jgi:hypothetical protein
MARKPTIEKVIETVTVLGALNIDDVARVGAVMGNWQSVNAYMNALPQEESSLRTLRAMLAHELARDGEPRDLIVSRVAARHEQLSKKLHFEAIAQALPNASSGLRRFAAA